MSWHLKNLTSLCFQKILSTQIRFKTKVFFKKVAVYCKLGVASIQAVSLSQKSSQIQKSSSKTSDSVGSQTTQLGAGAFQLMVVHYVASLFILESTAKGENQIWHLWICACKTLVDGNKSSNDWNLDAKDWFSRNLRFFIRHFLCVQRFPSKGPARIVVPHCFHRLHKVVSQKKMDPKAQEW